MEWVNFRLIKVSHVVLSGTQMACLSSNSFPADEFFRKPRCSLPHFRVLDVFVLSSEAIACQLVSDEDEFRLEISSCDQMFFDQILWYMPGKR
jgi:hypothetical protein